MATEIINDRCNGWAVIHKSNLIDDDGRNYHIVEVRIEKGTDGKDHVTYGAEATCCGLKLKPSVNYGNFSRKEDQNSFRVNLAKWQNEGYELCGRCVGHFYKDQV